MTLKERLENYKALFDFTIRGICTHLEDDQPEPEEIAAALMYLKLELFRVLEEGVEHEAKHQETVR